VCDISHTHTHTNTHTHTHTHTHIELMRASALARVMRAAMPITAVASASVVHSAAVGGAVVGADKVDVSVSVSVRYRYM